MKQEPVAGEFALLEEALVRAGQALDYPSTPPLAGRVGYLLRRDPGPSGVWRARLAAWRPLARRIAVPLALGLILSFALLLVFPDARRAVAQFLGLPSLRIFYTTPTPAPTSTPQATPVARSATEGAFPAVRPVTATRAATVAPFTLCCEVTLDRAQARAGFPLLAPPDEQPLKVYYQSIYDNGAQVVMVFPEFTLYQARRWIYGKLVDGSGQTQTAIAEAQVRGQRGLWFSGAPHVVMQLDQNGSPIYKTERVVDANTLVWETGNDYDGIIYRIETRMTLEQAVRLAGQLTEVTR